MATKRRKRGTGGKEKYYFTPDTQAAIVEWQGTVERAARDKIYVERIHPAFDKLVENLINIYKFIGLHETFAELKSDCINFLFETIGKFDNSRGTNAFSYFNVVAKRWLIVRSKQRAQKTRTSVSLDESESLTDADLKTLHEYNFVQSHEVDMHEFSMKGMRLEMLYEVRDSVQNENEMRCINAIITIYENAENIDIITKTAVMSYMKEITGLSHKQLVLALQGIKRSYKEVRRDMLKGEDEWSGNGEALDE